MTEVTKQPVTMIINKYFGFKQLNFLNDNKIGCVLAKEINDFTDNIMICSDPNKLWSIRVAAMTGKDFDLPSIIGVNNDAAIEWIKEQHNIEKRYIFMCSEYFESKICGRMHIDKFSTLIEASCGDFKKFKHTIPDLSVISYFDMSYSDILNTQTISVTNKLRLIELAEKLKDLYAEEFEEYSNILYEFDFAFGYFQNTSEKELDLRIIGMRGYDLSQKKLFEKQ
ncbi:hypothetical protein J6Q66_01365 [bacterium]|nr:hypothetical protein [bacterium]